MDAPGNPAVTAVWNQPEFDSKTWSVSAYTGKEISNLFDNADLNKYPGSDGQTVVYLTRSDWEGTFPATQSLYATDTMWADGLTHEESGRAAIAEKMKELYWQGSSVPAFGKDDGLNAIDFAGVPYDDPPMY